MRLGNELTAAGSRPAANTYYTAANKIPAGIESKLLVHTGSTAYFIEGLNDNVQSLDADALGALYLHSRHEDTVAQEVLSYADTAFALGGRSIVHSSNPATYNMTYAADCPFTGFEPYLGVGAPDVVWTEGSAEMLLAQTTLGPVHHRARPVVEGDRRRHPERRSAPGRSGPHQPSVWS
jgi:hypothetical protein